MKLGVPRQRSVGETRVPLTPGIVKKLTRSHVEVVVEAGAGVAAHAPDADYEEAGATIAPDGAMTLWSDADVVVTLEPPGGEQLAAMRPGTVLIGMLGALQSPDLVTKLLGQKVTAFSMELLPRISRAQSMDVLSSQASLGGYKAVILAANASPKMFPMMITAAGTIAPAKAFILGAGVAGLQAIATAKRLGAVVEAFDVRAATKEQVQSLGARFVELPTAGQDDKATGGYAKEQTAEERQQQAELMAKHVTAADIVVTTAAVPGKAPPMLVPADVVGRMQPGSVLVDLAASPAHGHGNCELTRPGEVITTDRGVTLIGTLNLPALLPANASQVYANNMHSFLGEILDLPKEGEPSVKLDLDDEIQKGACVCHDGQLVSEMVKKK